MSAIEPGVYKAILRVREARRFDLGAFLMRFYGYMGSIGTITMLTLSGRSFMLAGLVSSTIALSVFLLSPRVSKLVDQHGQSRIVPLASMVTMVGLVAMLLDVGLSGPDWLLFPAAVLMGFIPSPQALARARWTYLIRTGRLGEGAPELRTMFSYEGVLDDVGFMFGPAISIALASSITPVAGLALGGVAFVVGAALLCSSRSTEPEPGWGAPDGGRSAQEGLAHAKSVIRTSRVVLILFALMLLLGAFFGMFDTATVALAEELGDPNIASFILMVSSCVSMVVGFLFGMVSLRTAPAKLLLACAVLIGCAYGTMAIIDSVPTLYVVSLLGALFYAPFLIVVNATAERAVPGSRLTEAITWVNAGGTCGLAFGPSVGGIIIDGLGAPACFDVGAVIALVIPVLALATYRLVKRSLRTEAYEPVSDTPVHGGREG